MPSITQLVSYCFDWAIFYFKSLGINVRVSGILKQDLQVKKKQLDLFLFSDYTFSIMEQTTENIITTSYFFMFEKLNQNKSITI